MSFCKKSTVEIRQHAVQALKRLGHKFSDDWIPVRHRPNNDYHLTSGSEMCVVDAISITCTEPKCEMTFDINNATFAPEKTMRFLLWHHCGGLAEYRVDHDEYGDVLNFNFVPHAINSDKYVCHKFIIMT